MLFQRSLVKLSKLTPSRNRQQGVVIVVALFIVALVATMAYFMMARLQRDIHRTSLIVHDTQAEFYAQGSIAWAIDQLRNNWEKQKPKQLIDSIPIRSPDITENGYHIVSTIYDMQARYNLNNLTALDARTDFKRLLQAVVPKITEAQAQQIVSAITNWITPGTQQSRSPHRPMFSMSELRLVKGITPEIFTLLQPYVTALPPPILVNVQTAPAQVMITLGSTMTLETGKTIEQLRETTLLISTSAFLNLDVMKNHPVTENKLTVISNYFLVETNVSIENQRVVLYTLLQRKTSENKASIDIVWQSKGVW